MAGPCSSCPKASIHTPGLFEDEAFDNGDIRAAKCRDPLCWKQKMDAVQARDAAKALEAQPDAVLVDEQYGHVGDLAKAYPWAGRKVLRSTELHRLEKKEKGAVPAVFLRAGGEARTGWVRPAGWATERAKREVKKAREDAKVKAEPKRSPAARLASSMEDIRRRRMAFVVDSARDHVARFTGPVSEVSIYALLGSYAAADLVGGDGYTMIGSGAQKRRIENFGLHARDRKAWQAQLWRRMRHSVQGALRRMTADDLEGDYAEACAVLKLLDVDREPFEAEAVKKVPDPKWWGTKQKAGKAKKAPAKKAKR
jgi:hypothetical protein